MKKVTRDAERSRRDSGTAMGQIRSLLERKKIVLGERFDSPTNEASPGAQDSVAPASALRPASTSPFTVPSGKVMADEPIAARAAADDRSHRPSCPGRRSRTEAPTRQASRSQSHPDGPRPSSAPEPPFYHHHVRSPAGVRPLEFFSPCRRVLTSASNIAKEPCAEELRCGHSNCDCG